MLQRAVRSTVDTDPSKEHADFIAAGRVDSSNTKLAFNNSATLSAVSKPSFTLNVVLVLANSFSSLII